MSVLGLELALREHGISFERTKVGDRHVLSRLREVGGTIGGETSGHVLCLDRTTTGDGIITALQVVHAVQSQGDALLAQLDGLHKLPQHLVNVRMARKFDFTASDAVSEAQGRVERALGSRGRVLLRASGTEPVIRVMVEGVDAEQVSLMARRLAAVVEDAAA